MIKFSVPRWRFKSPGPASQAFRHALYSLLVQVTNQIADDRQRWGLVETLKQHFTSAIGEPHYTSTSYRWALSDLDTKMLECVDNAPLLIVTFVNACEQLQAVHKDEIQFPGAGLVNELMIEHGVGYVIVDQTLMVREADAPIAPLVAPLSLDETARELVSKTFQDVGRLLSTAGEERRAVAEMLWLLETFSTAFNGLESPDKPELGSYFNKVIGTLRSQRKGTPFDQIMVWLMGIHGYLSSPTGGGVRHGTDILNPRELGPGEAQLYVNLMSSYLHYLMGEYDRLAGL